MKNREGGWRILEKRDVLERVNRIRMGEEGIYQFIKDRDRELMRDKEEVRKKWREYSKIIYILLSIGKMS